MIVMSKRFEFSHRSLLGPRVLLDDRLSAVEQCEPPAAVDQVQHAAESIWDGWRSAVTFEDDLRERHEPDHIAVSACHRVVPGPTVGDRLGEDRGEESPQIVAAAGELSLVGAEEGGVVKEQIEHASQVAPPRAADERRECRVRDGLGSVVVGHALRLDQGGLSSGPA